MRCDESPPKLGGDALAKRGRGFAPPRLTQAGTGPRRHGGPGTSHPYFQTFTRLLCGSPSILSWTCWFMTTSSAIQFSVGLCTESMTRTGSGPLAGCRCKPNCSSIAAASEGPEGAAAAGGTPGPVGAVKPVSGVHCSLMSYRPFNPVLSTTGRPAYTAPNASARSETGCA